MKDKIKQKLSNLKNKKSLSIIFLLVLIVLVSGTTYAFWSDSFFTNSNAIKSGSVSINYTESSNVITIGNALPITDNNGKAQTDYFDFSITSNMSLNSNDPSSDINYEIILEPMSVDTGYTALTNSQIKVYLENSDDSSSLVGPILISSLNDSGSNKILLSTSHTHSYGTNSITTNYRLRAWIDFEVDASSWTSETKYEYKFKVNVNGEVDYLEMPTSTSCFEFVSDGNGGVKITDYLCDESTINQTSTSLDNNSINFMPNNLESSSSSKKLANEVVTDIIIPSTVTVSLITYPTQEELTDEDRAECAKFFADSCEEVGSISDDEYDYAYQLYYEICSGEDSDVLDTNLAYERARLASKLENFPEMANLKVFEKRYLPEETYTVTSIGEEAFENKGITSVVIPKTIKKIGYSAFYGNDLTSVTIPNSVTEIGNFAFGYNNLTSITIPNSVETVGTRAFYHNNLTSVIISNSMTTIEDYTFAYNDLTSITIPSSIETIGADAFFYNDLESVTIPNNVTTIGTYAFGGNNLTSINIPASLTTIGAFIFYGNSNLASITVDSNNTKYSDMGANAIIETDTNTLVAGCKNTIIPNSVTAIGEGAFSKLNLTSIDIPNSVTEIGDSAFSWNALTSITIPDSVTKIGGRSLAYNKLTSVSLPNSVKTIGDSAFYDNELTDVTFGSSVASIGEYAFYDNSITNLSLPSSLTEIKFNAFNMNELTSITVDSNNAKYSDMGANAIIDITTNTLVLGGKNTVIPNSVTTIGDCAFYDKELTSITIPDSVTTIGSHAFYGNNLTSLTIPDSVTTIGSYAFYGNDLTSLTIPNSVTTIEKGAFWNNSLTSIVIPDSVTEIGSHAFYNNNLTSVTISNSITTIKDWTFADNQLSSVTIPDSVTKIESYAFMENNLTSLTIPSPVTYIGHEAFGWNDLSYVLINSDSNLTAETGIRVYAFWGNRNLTTIYNNSGKAFDWSRVLNRTSADTFITGTITNYYGDTITITTGSPS